MDLLGRGQCLASPTRPTSACGNLDGDLDGFRGATFQREASEPGGMKEEQWLLMRSPLNYQSFLWQVVPKIGQTNILVDKGLTVNNVKTWV